MSNQDSKTAANEKLKREAIAYHTLYGVPGKISTKLTKPCETQKDLSLAYTPGVGMISLEIGEHPEAVWKYTNRGNLVAVLSDGSAILGLGDLGPEASYPVMEGKALLFKNFADVDAIPLCINARKENGKTDPAQIIRFAKQIAPTLGGINLEDIKGPECFEVEEGLMEELNIPVFHDDQHGTAIITLAALYNSIPLTDKKLENIKCVFLGAGAAGIATARLYVSAGVKRENIILCDSKGVIYKNREENMNPYKAEFATESKARTLEEAFRGADVFIGVSYRNLVTPKMVRSMAEKPVIFAMANPFPEIMPEDAKSAGGFIIGTGRSDFPNQVNNVLGFPGIFRGVLDTNARSVNVEMKIAAAKALAELAQEEIPADIKDFLCRAYPQEAENKVFEGKNPLKSDYVIPKPLDPRVVPRVAVHVAREAMSTGVARYKINDFSAYENAVAGRIDTEK